MLIESSAAGLTFAELRCDACTARIALQGAQLLDWTPAGQEPVLWLSRRARFSAGKAIRGGVPLCWPWFGPHAVDRSLPAHGFARTSDWEMTEPSTMVDGSCRLGFRLSRAKGDGLPWPRGAAIDVSYRLGSSLEIALTTKNYGTEPIEISEALHAYFRVGDVRAVRLHGLDGAGYIDSVDGGKRERQAGPVAVSGEVDRLYQGTESECIIEDPVLKRRIRIEKRGSGSTVVWNPWIDKSASLGDFDEGGYLSMLCVESANAGNDAPIVAPGQAHTLWVRYSVEPIADDAGNDGDERETRGETENG